MNPAERSYRQILEDEADGLMEWSMMLGSWDVRTGEVWCRIAMVGNDC